MASANTLRVTVRSRQGIVFDGELVAVSSVNTIGPFDILPQHTNFVSMIMERVVLRKPDGKTDTINLENGVLMVENNEVKIFLGVSKV